LTLNNSCLFYIWLSWIVFSSPIKNINILEEFSDITVNHNGSLIATCCTQDRSVKVFDVINFDMIVRKRIFFKNLNKFLEYV